MAHLLPQLRCQFAEFLNQRSLTRLGILTPPTWVGLRYGQLRDSSRSFSWKHGITEFLSRSSASSPLGIDSTFVPIGSYEVCLLAWTWITNHQAQHTLLRPCSIQRLPNWCRNINLLPITYPFRAQLRHRLTHGRIILPQETLGLRRQDFSSCLSLLMPA